MTTTTTKAELQNWFTYHPPTPAQNEAYEELRSKGLALAEAILENCPASADTDAAIFNVRKAVMIANQAIATHQPGRAVGSSR